MAEIFEVRRHSTRGEGDALSPEGLELAERARQTLLDDYHACYTSPKGRCIQTLEALGFTSYTIVPEFGTPPPKLADFDRQVQTLRERTGCSFLEAYLTIPATRSICEEFGRTFFEKVSELVQALPPGKNALAISHGGSIEPAVLAGMPEWSLETMGGELCECEGARFVLDGGILRGVEIVRL